MTYQNANGDDNPVLPALIAAGRVVPVVAVHGLLAASERWRKYCTGANGKGNTHLLAAAYALFLLANSAAKGSNGPSGAFLPRRMSYALVMAERQVSHADMDERDKSTTYLETSYASPRASCVCNYASPGGGGGQGRNLSEGRASAYALATLETQDVSHRHIDNSHLALISF